MGERSPEDRAHLEHLSRRAETLTAEVNRLRADAVVLDEELLAILDKHASRHKLDRAGYLTWVLTGKEPTKGTG